MKYSRIIFLFSLSVIVLLITFSIGLFLLTRRLINFDKYPRHYVGSDISFFDHNDGNKRTYYSKFGTIEYECIGMCSCYREEQAEDSYEDDYYRRGGVHKTGSLVTKTLSYFVVSVTSFVAFDSAKRYFQERCEGMIDEIGEDEFCDSNSIHSEVETCEEVVSSPEPHRDSLSYDVDGNFVDIHIGRYFYGRKYLCIGGCKGSYNYGKVVKEIISTFGCESYRGEEKEIRVFHPGETHPKAEKWFLDEAARIYKKNYLESYCNSIYQPHTYEFYEKYKDQYPLEKFFKTNQKSIMEREEIEPGTIDPGITWDTRYLTSTRKIFCISQALTHSDKQDDKYNCRFAGSFSVGNKLRDDDELQNYGFPSDYQTKKTDGDFFPHELDKNEYHRDPDEQKEIEFWGYQVREYKEGDDRHGKYYSDPPPHHEKLGEDFFQALVAKECEEEGDREKLEKLYELYMKWYQKNEDQLPQKNRLAHLGKYHVIANLLEWMKRGGDPKIFLEVEKKPEKKKLLT